MMSHAIRLRVFVSSIFLFLLTSCHSQPDLVYKGQDLDNLDQAANFIHSKNLGKSLSASGVIFDEKAFLLGAYDLRDDIETRIPEETYETQIKKIKRQKPGFASFTTTATSNNQEAEEPADEGSYPEGLDTPHKQISYLTGRSLAKYLSKQGIAVIPSSMISGIKEATSKSAPRLNEQEEKTLLKAIKEKLDDDSSDWTQNRLKYYQTEEKKFFANNITQPGVMNLDSGVQYKVIHLGTGKKPTVKDEIMLNYRGKLLDGSEFDSSYARKKSDRFKLKEMIPGFIQAMEQIPEGSSAIFYIPAQLAYKDRGAPGIPANAAVIFEIELLKINP